MLSNRPRLKKLLSLIGIHIVEDGALYPLRGLLIMPSWRRREIDEIHLVFGVVGFARDWREVDFGRIEVFCRQMYWMRLTYSFEDDPPGWSFAKGTHAVMEKHARRREGWYFRRKRIIRMIDEIKAARG